MAVNEKDALGGVSATRADPLKVIVPTEVPRFTGVLSGVPAKSSKVMSP